MSDTTSAPRPEKAAVVAEVAEKLQAAEAVFVTEYRGMTVANMATLRAPLRELGAEHKVYKNTLVRIAANETGNEALVGLCVGPTALTFVSGDVAAVAKALTEQAKVTPTLVVKGGVIDGTAMTADDVKALADLPSRDTLLAMLAGAFQAPLVKTAGLLQALPRNFAYGLAALVEQKEAA